MNRIKKLVTVQAVIGLVLVGCVLPLSTVYAQTPTPQVCTNFDNFDPLNNPNPSLPPNAALQIGTVHGQDGWTPANLNGGWTVSDMWGYTVSSSGVGPGLAFDEQVVQLAGGAKAWRMSNARYFSGFSYYPFSSVLPDALVAGETGAYLYNAYGPDHTAPLGEPANKGRIAQTNYFCASFDFKSATGVSQPGLRLDVNAASKQSATRYTLTKLEDLAGGLAVSYYDMDLGVYLPVASGLARDQWHNVRMEIQFVDGNVPLVGGSFLGNDIVTISVDGGPAVVSTTWESYYAQYEPTRYPLAVDSLRFMSRAAVPALDGGGFLFDNVCLSCPPPAPPPAAGPGSVYRAIVGNDALVGTGVVDPAGYPGAADPFYASAKYQQFMFDQIGLSVPVCFSKPGVPQECEVFNAQTAKNQPEICDLAGKGSGSNGTSPPFTHRGLPNVKTPAGNSGWYEWWIRLPIKPSGEINIVIQCGVVKPNAFAVYDFDAVKLCAAETGERIGYGVCVRQEVDPGVSPVINTALPKIKAIAYPGPYNDFVPFNLTAFKNPSSYTLAFDAVTAAMSNNTNSQVLEGSSNTRILLKACMDKAIVTKLPVTGQINALGQTETDLEPGDMIYVRMDVPRQNSVDLYCHAQSARLMGQGEPPF